MTPGTAGARSDLADLVSVGMPGYSVYPEPPDGIHAPAVVIGPGDPYREPTAYRVDDVRLRATVLLSEQQVGRLDALDAALDALLGILRTDPRCAIRQVGQVGRVIEVGGVGYLAAVVELTLGIERTVSAGLAVAAAAGGNET